MTWRSILLVALAVTAGCSQAATVKTATPATIEAMLNSAVAGDTIKLAPGTYEPFIVARQDWTPSVTVDASAATLSSVGLRGVSGLTWRGGAFDGQLTRRSGLFARSGSRIVVEGTKMRQYLRVGVVFSEVSDSRIANNAFRDMQSDGIDIALSRRIVIDRNTCEDFTPAPGAHPDCIQLWSRPTVPPTGDITITNNVAVGTMQGITLFNHVRKGVDDGGFDRVKIADNTVKSTFYNGIVLTDCRDCVARGNRIDTLPNPKAKAWLMARGTGEVAMCGNVVSARPGSAGQQPCDRRDRK